MSESEIFNPIIGLDESIPENNIVFNFTEQQMGAPVEVMRISMDGITVNPNIPMDDAAKYVISALDMHIKAMIAQARTSGV